MSNELTQHTVLKTMVDALASASGLSSQDVARQLTLPPKPEMGDYAFPCFAYGKANKMPPPAAAAALAEKLKSDPNLSAVTERIEAAGPFLNIALKPGKLNASIFSQIRSAGTAFGKSDEGRGKTIVIDYSAPNIAKPFHVGHLMSTIIGASLVRIFRTLGYTVVGVNHLGDWGVQCGFQFMAWQRQDPAEREKQLAERGLDYLCELYIDINDAAKSDPAIDINARALFKKLEDGDPELRALWERLRKKTLEYLQLSYDRIGVKFESDAGEAFYEPMLKPLIAELKASGVAKESEGALVIPMEDGPPKPGKDPKPPLILLKSDEATIYATRDLAAALYRKKTYDFFKNIYVIDMRQNQHMQMLFKALSKIGHAWSADCVHVSFGLMQIKEGEDVKAMSTRGGRMISLKEVLDHMVAKVRNIVREKNPDLAENKAAAVAEAVGVGAIVFWIQARRRASNFVFDWDNATDPSGDTGTYLQYTHARACSILRKAGDAAKSIASADLSLLVEPEEVAVAKSLERFPKVLHQAAEDYEPSLIASWLLDVSSVFGNFLNKHRVLDSAPDLKLARLALVDTVRQMLASGLGIIGVAAPDEM
jgi:arginyl-tRNA synthetase